MKEYKMEIKNETNLVDFIKNDINNESFIRKSNFELAKKLGLTNLALSEAKAILLERLNKNGYSLIHVKYYYNGNIVILYNYTKICELKSIGTFEATMLDKWSGGVPQEVFDLLRNNEEIAQYGTVFSKTNDPIFAIPCLLEKSLIIKQKHGRIVNNTGFLGFNRKLDYDRADHSPFKDIDEDFIALHKWD